MGNVEKILVAVIMTTIVVILALAIYGLGTDPGTPGTDEPGGSTLALEKNQPNNMVNLQDDPRLQNVGTILEPRNPGAPSGGISDGSDGRPGMSEDTKSLLDLDGEIQSPAAPPVARETELTRKPEIPQPERRESLGTLSASPIEGFKVYAVRKGDTLSSITRQFYGEEKLWRSLLSFNADVIPDRLRPGTSVLMPPLARLQSTGSRSTALKSALGADSYRVVKGDTLIGIARRELQDASQWKRILELNRGILTGPQDLRADMILTLR